MGDPMRIDHVVTSGTFNLDGGSWAVDNNVWLVGDDEQVVVIDAAHDADAILRAVDGRDVTAIVCTHAHDDHVNAAPALSDATGAPIMLHPDDTVLWKMAHETRQPDAELSEGQVITAGGHELHVLHTPGHAPGAVTLYAPASGAVFSGDTLFRGGPGATGRSHSDFATILASIGERLLELPPQTVVHPGHGETTTIGEEAPAFGEWERRGY
jgi:glyoxylase-like metal-dependent hydrolase (beta-lactamase superfamily II)